jgi:hypothetical protein
LGPGGTLPPPYVIQTLTQGQGRGAWTYDTRSFTYQFSFKTDRTMSGCAILDFGVKKAQNLYNENLYYEQRLFFQFK